MPVSLAAVTSPRELSKGPVARDQKRSVDAMDDVTRRGSRELAAPSGSLTDSAQVGSENTLSVTVTRKRATPLFDIDIDRCSQYTVDEACPATNRLAMTMYLASPGA